MRKTAMVMPALQEGHVYFGALALTECAPCAAWTLRGALPGIQRLA